MNFPKRILGMRLALQFLSGLSGCFVLEALGRLCRRKYKAFGIGSWNSEVHMQFIVIEDGLKILVYFPIQ